MSRITSSAHRGSDPQKNLRWEAKLAEVFLYGVYR
jgi:hypothetical protein